MGDSDAFHDFQLAVVANSIDIVEELVDSRSFDINTHGPRGLTPLHIACAHGRLDIVNLLIERQANIYYQARSTGVTALHIAASNGFAEVVQVLMASGADTLKRDSSGSTPLDYAEMSPQTITETVSTPSRIESGDEKLICLRQKCVRLLQTS
jgi:ankyrin repeat protein